MWSQLLENLFSTLWKIPKFVYKESHEEKFLTVKEDIYNKEKFGFI